MKVSLEMRGVENAREWYRSRALNLVRARKTVELFARGERNHTIAMAQAAQDRNPFFVSRAEQLQLRPMIAEGLSDALRTNDGRALEVRLDAVAEAAADFMCAHIDRRQSAGPPPAPLPTSPHRTRPLTAAYAARKRKALGTALPELVYTGEFYASIEGRVVK